MSNPRGEVAATKITNGDTVAVIVSGSPDSDKASESNQLRFTSPGVIKPTAVQNAGKRKLGLSLPAKF